MKTNSLSLKSIFFVLMLGLLASCKKEDSANPTNPENNNNSNPWGSSINLNISGKVLDDATGNPVIGATIWQICY
jgi:hypothetical protein